MPRGWLRFGVVVALWVGLMSTATVAGATITVTYAQGVYGNFNPPVYARTQGQAQRVEQWTYHTDGVYWCSEYGDASTILPNHE